MSIRRKKLATLLIASAILALSLPTLASPARAEEAAQGVDPEVLRERAAH